jgi:DNA mismatch repair ATPase MutS
LALHEEPTLDSRSTKVHFREHVDDQGGEVLTFDYLLRPGLATSRNALRLLRIVGLDESEDAPRS